MECILQNKLAFEDRVVSLKECGSYECLNDNAHDDRGVSVTRFVFLCLNKACVPIRSFDKRTNHYKYMNMNCTNEVIRVE